MITWFERFWRGEERATSKASSKHRENWTKNVLEQICEKDNVEQNKYLQCLQLKLCESEARGIAEGQSLPLD